jgi:hypothetical protein
MTMAKSANRLPSWSISIIRKKGEWIGTVAPHRDWKSGA